MDEPYEAPKVDQIPTESGPSVSAADASGPSDASGPEWRPPEEER